MAISQFFNARLLVGGFLSITPMLFLYTITYDQRFVIGSIVSISFFYMLATEPETKKSLIAVVTTCIISIILLLCEQKKSVMTFPLLILISFLPIIFRLLNLNKSTGMYASVAILFFSMPIGKVLMSDIISNQEYASVILLISSLPGVTFGVFFPCLKSTKRECKYESLDEVILESIPLAISSALCAAISIKLSNYDAPMLMWSCIVINSCKLENSKKKFMERFMPSVAGVALGYIIGMYSKDFKFTFLISSYATMLSLVAFKNYSFGFFIRCISLPVSVCALYQDDSSIYMRSSEIMIGGGISILTVYTTSFAYRKLWIERKTKGPFF